MNRDLLNDAKNKLRIPELWQLLNLPGTPGKSCRVPWRDDHNPSFSIFDDGLRWKDHATNEHGDAIDFLAHARGLNNADACREFVKMAGVADASNTPNADGPRRIVATYDYQDEAGALLFQVVRFEPKTFRQRRPDSSASDGWSWKLDGVRRVLYRLPEIIAAVQRGDTIVLAEGEKDVAALVTQGFAATCNPAGAGKWLGDYTTTLRGADVVIVADKDDVGRNHARLVAGKLFGHAKSIRIVELPDFNGNPVKDAHDYFTAGATADDLRATIAAAPPITVSIEPDLQAAPPEKISKPSIKLPEESNEPESPPFPVDALPSVMATIIAATSRCVQVPLALPGVCALGIVSAAIGAGLGVISGPNRVTSANLFLLASGESGSGKSEACRPIIAPLIEHQSSLLETWKQKTHPDIHAEIARREAERKAIEKKIARAMRADCPDENELQRLQAQLAYPIARIEQLKQQTAPSILADDFTIEALAMRLRDNHETMFCFSSDARKPIQNLMGRYNPGKTTDESLLLKGYTRESMRVDRAKGDPVNLHNPCIALCWFVQPDLLATMLDEESLCASGLLARLLLCHTHADWVKYDRKNQGISDSVQAEWARLIHTLLATYHDAEKPFQIAATPEAEQVLDPYQHRIYERRAELSDVKLFAARWCENAWRIALTLHAALHGVEAHNHPLAGETATQAVRVMEWFAASQLEILAKGRHAAATKLEDEVLDLLEDNHKRKGLDYITARDVHRARITATADAAHALLARMEADGLLVGEDITPPHGGKTTRIYRAANNPVV